MGMRSTSATTSRIVLPLSKGEVPRVSARPNAVHRAAGEAELWSRDFSEFFRNIYDACLVTTSDGAIVLANDRAGQFLRCDAAHLPGADVLQFLAGAESALLSEIRATLRNDRFVLIHANVLRTDGTFFAAEVSVNRLMLANRELLAFFLRDTTWRKQTETQMLSEHTAIHNAGNGICITDRDAVLHYVNPAMARLAGCETMQAMVGKRLETLFSDSAVGRSVAEYVLGGSSWNGEVVAKRIDGSVYHAQIEAAPNVDPDNEISGMVLSVVDITQQKVATQELERQQNILAEQVAERTRELSRTVGLLQQEIKERIGSEQKLRKAVEVLEQHDRAKSEFVFNVSHELKTPLSSMGYAVGNLLEGIVGPVPERMVPYLNMIQEDVHRLRGTIEDILDLSRISTDRMVLNPIKAPLCPFVRQVAEAMSLQFINKGISLALSCELPDRFCRVDPNKMERALLNVLNNAIKYSDEGATVELSVRHSTSVPDAAVILVTDDGPGIAPEHLSRLTERYFRAGNSSMEGTGLGLFLCREIVERHGGSIRIVSPPAGREKGTTVELTLPMVEGPAVLVAEDEPGIRGLVIRQLSAHGYKPMGCENGIEAMRMLHEGHYDVLVLDLNMAEMGGIEVIRKMKAEHSLRAISVLVLTGCDIVAHEKKVLDGYAIPVMAKPWKKEELISSMETAVMGRYYVRR